MSEKIYVYGARLKGAEVKVVRVKVIGERGACYVLKRRHECYGFTALIPKAGAILTRLGALKKLHTDKLDEACATHVLWNALCEEHKIVGAVLWDANRADYAARHKGGQV